MKICLVEARCVAKYRVYSVDGILRCKIEGKDGDAGRKNDNKRAFYG